MNLNEIVGLEVCDAESFLKKSGITNFKFVYYVDRKQTEFDKELVTAARQCADGCVEIVVCRYKLRVE